MPTKFVGYNATEERRLQKRHSSMLFSVPPDELDHEIATNGIIIPGTQFHRPGLSSSATVGLYSCTGDLIPSSCLFRGHKNLAELPCHIPNIARQVKSYEKGTYLYGGFLANHYGHILTESVSRLWFQQKEVSVDGVVFCGAQQLCKAAQTIFSELGVVDTRFILPHEVVQFERIIIPQPSMINLLYVHQQHVKLFRDNKPKLLGLRQTNRPLYLSRRLLKNDSRRVVNEGDLEDILMSKGVQVEHPQFLSIREQIRLMNEHEIIIGLSGSALHTVLFADMPKKMIHLGSSAINANYPLLDAACNNQAVYLNCVKGTKGEAKVDVGKVWPEIQVMIEDI